MKASIRIAIAMLVAWSGTAVAAEHVVSLKDHKFSVSKLPARLGDTVTFRNDDPVPHSLFSLSKDRSFDLGSFAKGEARKIFLTKEGRIDVECANHSKMKMVIEVGK